MEERFSIEGQIDLADDKYAPIESRRNLDPFELADYRALIRSMAPAGSVITIKIEREV